MTNKEAIQLSLVSIAIAACVLLVLWFSVYSKPINSAFRQVELGMNRHEVLSIMGDPEKSALREELEEHVTHQSIVDEGLKSSAIEWMLYYDNFNSYAIGLDQNEIVVVKSSGGP